MFAQMALFTLLFILWRKGAGQNKQTNHFIETLAPSMLTVLSKTEVQRLFSKKCDCHMKDHFVLPQMYWIRGGSSYLQSHSAFVTGASPSSDLFFKQQHMYRKNSHLRWGYSFAISIFRNLPIFQLTDDPFKKLSKSYGPK